MATRLTYASTASTPELVHVPSGCRFHPRCPVAEPRCAGEDPALEPPRTPADSAQRAACLLA